MPIRNLYNLKETVSAGGVVRRVVDGRVEIVLVRESEKHDWVLPKGHVEEGETLEQAAIREVREETGLLNLKIVKKLGASQRASFQGDEWKTIHYFLFDCHDNKPLTDVKDNGKVLTPQWFSVTSLPRIFWPEQDRLIKENLAVIQDI